MAPSLCLKINDKVHNIRVEVHFLCTKLEVQLLKLLQS